MAKIATKTATRRKTYRTSLFTESVCAAVLMMMVSAAHASLDISQDTRIQASSNGNTHTGLTATDCDTHTSADAPTLKFQSSNRQQLDCMLAQAKSYQTVESTPRQRYFAYKAQAWINYAIHEDSKNSRTTEQNEAMQAASALLQALKDGTDADLNLTPDIPTTSALMRPDLWATLNALKDSGGIDAAPRELAFSEVALIWAAADQCARHPKQAATNFRMSDRWLEYAREAYINAHDDTANVALENLINTYYTQFAPLDATDDRCQGLIWPHIKR